MADKTKSEDFLREIFSTAGRPKLGFADILQGVLEDLPAFTKLTNKLWIQALAQKFYSDRMKSETDFSQTHLEVVAYESYRAAKVFVAQTKTENEELK